MLSCVCMLSGLGLLMVGCAEPADDRADGASGSAEWTTLAAFEEAHRTVSRALEALGGADAIARAGGLALDGEGVLDLGTLLQGRRPFEGGDTHTVEERLALVPAADRLVHESRAPLNPDALVWQRTDYRPDGTYRIDLQTGRATWSRPASRLAAERTVPHLLLDEILRSPESLRHLGVVSLGGEAREAVSWQPPERPLVTLLFHPETALLREIEALADLPVRGDARIRWTLLPYEDIPGLGLFPTGYTIHVDEERLKEVRWTSRTAAPSGGVLDPPNGILLPEPVPFPPAASTAGGQGGDGGANGAEEEPFDIRELAPGVHLLVNLRTGFHMLFVELEDHVVAVDAPAGWWELEELPPRDWARSPSPALGERYVQGIRSRVGDKPIRYVVLTHHHSDHMGGVRAFVEEGATVLGPEDTRAVVERTLAGSLRLAGYDEGTAPPLRFEAVDGGRTIGDGSRALEILDVGENPHTDQMLAIWLPDERFLYVSDLFEPWGPQSTPSPERIPVMRWFVEWLDASGLDPEQIYAIHRAARVSEENLEEIRRGMPDGG